MTTKLQIEELLVAFERATGMGSVKAANKLLPEIVRAVISYVEEVTAGPEASDLEFFQKRYSDALASGDQHRIDVAKRQLDVLEDAIVIYKVQQSPERKQFFVDVGGLPQEKIEEHLEAIKDQFTQREAVIVEKLGAVCPPCDVNGDAPNKINFDEMLVIKNPAPDASPVRAPTGRSKTITMPEGTAKKAPGRKPKVENAPAPKKPKTPPKR